MAANVDVVVPEAAIPLQNIAPSPTQEAKPRGFTVTFTDSALTEEPTVGAPPATQPSSSTAYDRGFVPRGYHREAHGDGWRTVKDEPNQGRAALDIFEDGGTFMEDGAEIQVVTFYMEDDNCKQAKWERSTDIKKTLQGQEEKTWKWIHCEGLHGPTMKSIAEATDWRLDRFAGIFAWTRPSAEWADGCLLVHFLDQTTPIWMLYKEQPKNPIFITCTKQNPDPALKKRWEDYVDYGDSRPNLLLRKDPSLMLYAMMRAVILDLRATSSQKHKDMSAAYDLAMLQPSQKSLRYFYELQQSLIRVKLDTTSLRDAATNLNIFVDKIRKDAEKEKNKPLVSAETQYMLKDQMGLIHLLFEELPEVTRQAEAVANLAFNSLSFSTNNLLRLLAVLTIASVPLTIATGILGANYFDGTVMDGQKIAIILGSVSGAIVLGLILFIAWGYNKLWHPRYRKGIQQRDAGLQARSDARKAEQRFADLEAQNSIARTHQSKKDSMRPDLFLPVIPPAEAAKARPDDVALPSPATSPRRSTAAFATLARSFSLQRPPPSQ